MVYEAVAVDLNRRVALKLLREELLAQSDWCDRFRDEAEAVARLTHPNVVQIYEVGVHDSRPFLAMEFVPGGSLADRLTAGPLSVTAAIDLVRSLARAVQHAHDRGVIHRDIKPGNVLLSAEECSIDVGTGSSRSAIVPKLTDFGLAKLLDRDHNRTRPGMLLGTPAYMAPEAVVDGHGTATASVDVYGLGVILYECLTACPPVAGTNTWATLRQVVESDPEPPGQQRPGVSPELDAICLKALAKDPAARYPSARALAEDLDRLAAGRTVLARKPARSMLRELWRRSVGQSGGVVAIALIVALLVFGVLDYRTRYQDGVEAERVGRELLDRGAYDEAERMLTHGLGRVEQLPGTGELTQNLNRDLRQSRRGRRVAELHRLVDRFRFGYDADSLAGSDLKAVVAACDALWQAREALAPEPGTDLRSGPERQLRTDLLDLTLLSADFRMREGNGNAKARWIIRSRLDEIESLLGPDPAVQRIRTAYEREPDFGRLDPTDPTVSAWELYALGRTRLNTGDLEPAANLLHQAVDRDPQGFWPNFHLAICAYRRGRYEEAVAGFSVCLSLARDRRGVCYYHRGLAYAALAQGSVGRESAIRDFDRALDLEPTLAEAALHRGLLHHEAKRFPQAVVDLERALHNGYAPTVVYYHLATVTLSAGDRLAARAHAGRAVDADPTNRKAQTLLSQLQTDH